jgi:CheY-like chemotaxis protein
MIVNTAAPALGWPSVNVLWNATADESGSNPSQEKEPLSSSPSLEKPNQPAPPRWNLLLAEDNLPDALLVREAVRIHDLPLNIYSAADGQEAIAFIAKAEQDETAPCPHLLLLDLNLPKVEGFEVLRRLRESKRLAEIPVLIVSSSDSPGDRSAAAALSAGYFRKSTSYEEFLELGAVLKKLLEEHGLV